LLGVGAESAHGFDVITGGSAVAGFPHPLVSRLGV